MRLYRRQTFFALALLPFVLLACTMGLKEEAAKTEQENAQQQAVPVLPPEELITRNVTYTGLLEAGGATIYQEGSHRLSLADGKMVLLEPAEDATLALNLYEGKLVKVQGDVMPTAEAGGTLMRVKVVEWIRREKNEAGEETEVLRVLCGGGTPCPDGTVCRLDEAVGICMEESKEMQKERTEEREETGASIKKEEEVKQEESGGAEQMQGSTPVSSTEPASPVANPPSGAGKEQVGTMAAEDLSAERWTQQYCSPHIGFCIPIHKNWYFKSFGAMNSSLWHVEAGEHPVENLGDGFLTVDLKTGDLASLGITDGAVGDTGGKVIGYRTWSDNRHFEISADTSLKDAVSSITKGLKASP